MKTTTTVAAAAATAAATTTTTKVLIILMIIQLYHWARTAFILRGWQPHIEEGQKTLELMLLNGSVKFHLSAFRIWQEFSPWEQWQCGLAAAPDENHCYLFPDP